MSATDKFDNHASGLSSPAEDAFAITPDDATDMAKVTRGIYVGVGGDVALITKAGTTLTFKSAAAGSVLPVRAARVKSTGTTATNLIGLV